MPPRKPHARLSDLEHAVMQVLWRKAAASAEDVRSQLARTRDLKESTVRTLLGRLEKKGVVEHDVIGRTYVYRPRVQPQNLAVQQVRGIVQRLCRGSVESLLVGMVDQQMISVQALAELTRRIEQQGPPETPESPGEPSRGAE